MSVKLFLWAALGFATVLTGCAPIIDRVPSELGGLPAGAPARPESSYNYPAVHDMPPDRASTPMTEAEQVRLEKELINVRESQEGRPPTAKNTAPGAKKPPKDAQNSQTDGAKPKP